METVVHYEQSIPKCKQNNYKNLLGSIVIVVIVIIALQCMAWCAIRITKET